MAALKNLKSGSYPGDRHSRRFGVHDVRQVQEHMNKLSDDELEVYWAEAEHLAASAGKIFCSEVHNCCDRICFCAELARNWHSLSTYPKPPQLCNDLSNSGTISSIQLQTHHEPMNRECTKSMFKTFVGSISPLKVS